jgi:hypothetical protein
VHLASHEVVDHGAMILIAGFRTYWPNGTVSEFSRTRDGSHAINVVFENDGSISFMVNLYARQFRIESPARIEPRAGVRLPLLLAAARRQGLLPTWAAGCRTATGATPAISDPVLPYRQRRAADSQ